MSLDQADTDLIELTRAVSRRKSTRYFAAADSLTVERCPAPAQMACPDIRWFAPEGSERVTITGSSRWSSSPCGCRLHIPLSREFVVPPLGLEPRTCGLKVRSSTN